MSRTLNFPVLDFTIFDLKNGDNWTLGTEFYRIEPLRNQDLQSQSLRLTWSKDRRIFIG